MGKKLYIQDIVAIALLYRYKAINSTTISLDEVLNYYKTVSFNLDELSFNVLIPYPLVDSKKIYSFYIDANGKRFCKLNNNIDINKIMDDYIYVIPRDIIRATKMDNALEKIGLKQIEKTTDEKQYYKKRTTYLN